MSTGKVCFQHAELVNHLLYSEYENQDRSTLPESSKIEENFTLIVKENIKVGKTIKFSKIFNEENVNPQNNIHIEDSPNNRKIVNTPLLSSQKLNVM